MIVYGRELDGNVNQLIKASKKLGFETIPASITDLSAYISPDASRFFVKYMEIKGLEVCFTRFIGLGTHEQISRRINFMEHLELSGTFVINPVYAFRRARDKYATLYTLAKAGLPIPPTFVTENALQAYRFAKHSNNIVCKPMIGSKGYGVMRFADPDLAYNAFRLLERINQPIYVQTYIQKPGKDIRAFVIGDQVVAAIHRIAPIGHWKTNVVQGGKTKAVKLPREIKDLAVKSAQVLGLEYAGVDIIETSKGPIILEVNSSPSWQGLQRTTGIDIADHLIKYAAEKIAS